MRLVSLCLAALLGCAAPQEAAPPKAPAPPPASPPAPAEKKVDPEKKLDPGQAHALTEQATAAHKAKQYAESERLFKMAFALEPNEETAVSIACAAALGGRQDEAFRWLDTAVDRGLRSPVALNEEDLKSLGADPRWGKLLERMKVSATRIAEERGVGVGLTSITAEQAGLDAAALQTFLAEAEKAHSIGVVILKDGKLVGEWAFGHWRRPIEAMSATKSVVALAIGFLIADGKLKSLDAPLWELYPELRQGLKESLTVRHLLNHTSGIQAEPHTMEIYRSPDFVRLALSADLVSKPGEKFFYNNKAVNLLAGIVERASGQKLDDYLKARLFEPLGIRDVSWTRDSAGNPHGMSGLQIHPIDFAKIGQMLLDGGKWQGKQILPEEFIKEAAHKAGQPFAPTSGLLFWLRFETMRSTIPADASKILASRKAKPEWVKIARELEGKPLEHTAAREALEKKLPKLDEQMSFLRELAAADRGPTMTVEGPLTKIAARGYLGQVMLVYPRSRLVVVRMTEYDPSVPPDVLGFPQVDVLADKLVPAQKTTP